ncbi:MAG: 1-deoxy-D-xylulose-5-phosphate synthase [Phycisphaerae bacterium]|nr:1-deoxy-D-xylulose-5-phosphate synthase [Phycisphaerae bacterium]
MDDNLLDSITTPHQLRRLSEADLADLAAQIRQRIVDVVSRRGGHLASNLGISELTIALHYVFDFSRDRLLWDVGHQCYAHKILTGRARDFDMLRQADGLSGFPDPAESPYDLFATGHAGTAISTAAGLAWADRAVGRDTKVVAVVGDASIVNGLSLEGLNNAALLRRQFLIVLNDNSMAIDRTRGAMARVLERIRTSGAYGDLRDGAEHLLQHLPMGEEITGALRHLKAGLKTTLQGKQVFETLGFAYFGPVDGHDIRGLIDMLRRLSGLNRPALLHVHTQKGRGCRYAVEDPCRFHSPSAYRIEGDKAVFPAGARPTWTRVFADALVAAGRRDERIVAITAAMPDGTGLDRFRAAFPRRYIDVGISESHAVAMAAGLAKGGLKPVVAIYSTFMQRAMDQVFQEIALQRLPVVLCMDRAGLVGSDGAVHHGFLDIAFLRPLPGMVLMAPADAAEMSAALELALSLEGPSAIRYPRDEVALELAGPCPPFRTGKARIIGEGTDGTLVGYGTMVEPALRAAEILCREEDLAVAVIQARFAKPLDAGVILPRIASGRPMIIVEDHAVMGGIGSAVLELASAAGVSTAQVRLVGIGDRFIPHASRLEQLVEAGLDATHIAVAFKELIQQSSDHPRPQP